MKHVDDMFSRSSRSTFRVWQTDRQTDRLAVANSAFIASRGYYWARTAHTTGIYYLRSHTYIADGITNQNKSVLSLVPRLSTRRCPHLLLSAGCRRTSNRSMFTAGAALSSAAARRCCCRSTGQRRTDGRTDTRPLHRPFSAYYASSVKIK